MFSQRMANAGASMQPKKTRSGRCRIEYTGYEVTVGGKADTESLSCGRMVLLEIGWRDHNEEMVAEEHLPGEEDHNYYQSHMLNARRLRHVHIADPDVYDRDEISSTSSPKRPRISSREQESDGEPAQEDSDECNDEDKATAHPRRKNAKSGSSRMVVPLDKLTTTKCCRERCLEKIDISDATSARNMFQAKSLFDQSKHVMEMVANQISSSLSKKKVHTVCKFPVGHNMVCQTAWPLIVGLARATFFRTKKRVLNGDVHPAPRNAGRKGRLLMKTQRTINWLKDFAAKQSDYMPDANRICLPSSYTKAKVYAEYKQSIGTDAISDSHFHAIWHDHLSFISIPKTMRFAKCTICDNYLQQLRRCPLEQRQALMDAKNAHNKRQMDERQNYYRHREMGKKAPDMYLSMIIDGMDQQKTDIPHFAQMTKGTDKLEALHVHVTGVLVHGVGSYAFLDYGQFGRGANLVAAVLLSTLQKLRERAAASLPKTLFLQMDNAGENKNQYLMALCCYLVERELFDVIEISFLIVGHTHEDVDQLFSCISRYLRRHNALTVPQLMECIRDSCSAPHPECVVVDAVYNIKEWLVPCMRPIRGITRPHIFRFHRNDAGKAVLTYKEFSTDQEWLPCEQADPASPYVLKQRPAIDTLKHVDIDYSKLGLESSDKDNTKGIKNMMPEYENCFQYIDESAITWWRRFIDDISRKEGEEAPSLGQSVLHRLLPNILPLPPRNEKSAQEKKRSPMKRVRLM